MLSPAARACAIAQPEGAAIVDTQGSRTRPGLHAVARFAGLRARNGSISSSEFCYYGYARDLELVHIHERINGLFQGYRPADEPFGRQSSGLNHRE